MLKKLSDERLTVTDKRAEQFKNTNISPSTHRPYAARFDFEPGNRTESAQDRARNAFWALIVPRKNVLRFFSKYALHSVARRVGWTYGDPMTGGITVGQLAEIATDDCGFTVDPVEIAGACLFEGIRPTVSTAHKPYGQWILPVYYESIPQQLEQQFVDLKAAA
jgi:hypothetical protein